MYKKDYNDLIDLMFGNISSDKSTSTIPFVVREEKDKEIIELYCGGTKKEDIEIEVVDGSIVIKGELKIPKSNENTMIYGFTHYGKWSHYILIKDYMDIDNIESKYENGILSIKIPIKEKERKIIKIK